MSGYEDTFYVKSNIVGYTGNKFNYPTVYFRQGNRFGRITQKHQHANNIGRNKVRMASDYSIRNEVRGSVEVAIEFYNNRDRHTSRNKYCAATLADLGVLGRAIFDYQNLKSKYPQR